MQATSQLLIVILIFSLCGCSKQGTPKPKDEGQEISAADHVDASELPASRNFLHKQFTVTNYSEFAFTLPPHIVNPTLRGNFRAFTKGSSGSASSKPADIDLILMNEQEFDDFVHGRPADATYEADSSPSQTLNYAVPPTHDRAQAYHLVFRNSGGSRVTVAEADFTVSFQ